jgi:carbon storage regulator CsrA
MLVLTRGDGEGITICIPASAEDREIHLEVIEFRGERRVQIAFDAPRDVRIWRDEVLAKINAEQKHLESQGKR